MIITSSINNYIKLILFSSYILCWISISTTFQDIIAAKEMSEFEFKKIFNLVRHVSIYFCLIYISTTFQDIIASKAMSAFEF